MKRKILKINSLSFTLSSVNRAKVTALGEASTPGWTEPELGNDCTADGSLQVDFQALPPDGVVIQVVTPIETSRTFLLGPRPAVITVHSATNSESITLPEAGDPPK